MKRSGAEHGRNGYGRPVRQDRPGEAVREDRPGDAVRAGEAGVGGGGGGSAGRGSGVGRSASTQNSGVGPRGGVGQSASVQGGGVGQSTSAQSGNAGQRVGAQSGDAGQRVGAQNSGAGPRGGVGARNQRVGRCGEQVAAKYLRERGYRLLDRNWRSPDPSQRGELDLVLRDRRELVVCEVKTRTGSRLANPAEAVTEAKAARLRRLAAIWAREHARTRGTGTAAPWGIASAESQRPGCGRSDTGRSGAGRNGTGRSSVEQSGTGRSGAGRSGAGRISVEQSGSGRSDTGRSGTGRSKSGRSSAGRSGVGHGGPAEHAPIKRRLRRLWDLWRESTWRPAGCGGKPSAWPWRGGAAGIRIDVVAVRLGPKEPFPVLSIEHLVGVA